MLFSHFNILVDCSFCLYLNIMAVCSGGSSGMEMYDVSETRNADAYLVIILNIRSPLMI